MTDLVPLALLAAPYDGVLTQAALLAAGYHRHLSQSEVRAGRWQRLLPGTYLTSPGPATLRQRCHAAVLHAGPGAVVTGSAGCALRGIPFDRLPTPETVDVVVTGTRHPTSSGFCRVRRSRALPEHQLLRVTGHADLAVAAVPRCVADAVRAAPGLDAATALGAQLLRSPSVHWPDVAAEMRPGPSAGHLRQVLRDIGDGVRSAAEGQVHRVLLRAAGKRQLPPYLLNPELYLDGVLLGSPDVWFPGLGLGDEVDSREWHEDVVRLDETLRRHQRFSDAGLLLSHVTPHRFQRDPSAHVVELQRLVRVRRALAQPEPVGLAVLARGPLLPARTAWPALSPRRWR